MNSKTREISQLVDINSCSFGVTEWILPPPHPPAPPPHWSPKYTHLRRYLHSKLKRISLCRFIKHLLFSPFFAGFTGCLFKYAGRTLISSSQKKRKKKRTKKEIEKILPRSQSFKFNCTLIEDIMYDVFSFFPLVRVITVAILHWSDMIFHLILKYSPALRKNHALSSTFYSTKDDRASFAEFLVQGKSCCLKRSHSDASATNKCQE